MKWLTFYTSRHSWTFIIVSIKCHECYYRIYGYLVDIIIDDN